MNNEHRAGSGREDGTISFCGIRVNYATTAKKSTKTSWHPSGNLLCLCYKEEAQNTMPAVGLYAYMPNSVIMLCQRLVKSNLVKIPNENNTRA